MQTRGETIVADEIQSDGQYSDQPPDCESPLSYESDTFA